MNRVIARSQAVIYRVTDGQTGPTGPAGIDANLLDWVKDWNNNKSTIGSEQLITPKLFAGIKNTNGTISGIAIGEFTLKTVDLSGTVFSETINGIYGFKDGKKTFSIDSSGTVQLGWDNQYVKFNPQTGKIEFGEAVSLNWTGAISTAKAEAISSAASDATNKVNAIQLGLRNYIRNSSFKVISISGLLVAEGVTAVLDTATQYQGCNSIKITQTTATNVEATANRAYLKGSKICNPASFCMWVKSSVNTTLRIRLGANGTTDIPIGTDWKLIKLENRKPTSDVVLFGITTSGAIFHIALPMLVEGTKAVDWLPAPEDTESKITEAKTAGDNARLVADAITKKASDEQWDTKLTYIDGNGIFTGKLSANIVNSLQINASQITAGTIDAARINVTEIKASLITAANIEALTLNVTKGKIGGWNIDTDSIYRGAKNNAAGSYTATSGAITIGSNGIRGFKWKLDSNGTGALAAGNISWDATGNVTFGSSVSLNWTNAANNALNSAKSYADTKKTEAINTAATDATNKSNKAKTDAVSTAATDATNKSNQAKTDAINAASTDATNKANQAKTDAINTAASDATNKINALQIGGTNFLNNSGNWRAAGWNSGFSSNGGGYTIDDSTLYGGKPTLKTLTGQGIGHPWLKLDNGIEYTYSALVRCNETISGNGSSPLHLQAGLNNTSQSKLTIVNYDTSVTANGWKKISLTFKLTGDANSLRPFFYRGTNGTTTYWIAYIKLERGNKATDWSPSVSDTVTNIAEAKDAGINAQAIADAINKKATEEKWSSKLTYIDANGIFTGTLSANTVNAIKINASQITAGVIDASRINVTALKTTLITSANIEALTLNVTKGKIGGWSIGGDSINIGTLNQVGQTPIQIRSNTAGTLGNIYNGQIKPYGITMSWYQSSNAGHFIMGQVMASGTTTKTGYIGIQMMAWDGTEYFCLSANSTKSGAKEVYNRIAGWAFDNTRIWKNNVSLGADGSITNGNLWQINNNGSGRLANGNITWDTAGNITFGASVSLNWTNAANNALSTAKSYADKKKTEAINIAAADATGKVNQAKTELNQNIEKVRVEGLLYCKGTGMNRNANRMLVLSGKTIYNASGRGLQLTVIKRTDLSVVSNVLYDVYGDTNKRIELANKLNGENDSVIVILSSYDAIVIDDTLGKALSRCGGSGIMLTHRNPYVLVGVPGIGKGCGLEIYSGTEANAPYAEITTKITNGTPAGFNSTQGLALGNAAAAQSVADAITKKSNDEKWATKLTYIDQNGIFTGTLSANTVNAVKINASQITAGTISADRIGAGSINASKLDANSIKTSIINTGYINGLALTFVRGKIGGWNIGSDTINIGSIGAVGAMPIQIRSSSAGSGYVYSGQYKPYGITMSWHQSSNAGHFVFGQVMANGNNVKTGFIGIQMMSWDNQEYFCLSTNYTKSGAKEVYNRIAGWAFDNTRIWKNSVSLSADGSITNGNLWQINNNGSGRLANGNIVWDAAGKVTFGSSVSLNWTNAANNALSSAKSYADTKKTEAINTAATDATNKSNKAKTDAINASATDATNKANAAKELAQAMAFGRMLYRDPTFYNGNNSIGVYNNSNNGTVTVVRTTDNNAPNDSKQVLVIKNTGTANPNLGGFYFGTQTAYRKVFITRIIAKIPTGRNISYHSNSVGTGGAQKWLTPIAGTGDWCEYICKVTCGTAGFSSTHFFAITGTVGTAAAPVEWRLAYVTVFDVTSTEKYTTTIDANGIYTGTIRANQVLVDSALVVGGSSYNGSISVRDASNNVKVTLDRNGIKAVGGTIAGWTISANQISRNSVVLGADGSITNGVKWKLNNDGSGQVASGNVSWTAAGAVSITGTINATSGKIGGFSISGNRLINTATSSSLEFLTLTGSSSVSINASISTLLSMRADSARTALSIQTYATGARGISIIANAGSTYAIESYGPHQFGQRMGEKWNAPGILYSAIVKNGTALFNSWGNGLSVTSFEKLGTGNYRLRHNLGHTQYIVVATPYWDHGSNWHGNCFIRVEYINAYDCVLRVVNADNGKYVETCFSFAVIGRNKW